MRSVCIRTLWSIHLWDMHENRHISHFLSIVRLSFSSVSGNLGFHTVNYKLCRGHAVSRLFWYNKLHHINHWPYYLDGDELFQSSAERLKAKQEAFNKMIKKKLKRLQVQVLYPAPTSSDYEPILLFESQVRRWHSAKNRKWQTGNKYLKINIWNKHMLG